MLPHHRNIQ